MMNKTRWISLVITCFIIFLLILSGGANALTLTLTGFSSSNIAKGSQVTTLAQITINSGEIVINPLELHFSGPENRTCLFERNATLISGCQDINITLQADTTSIGYGYAPGFGFGNGSTNGALNYSITITTSNLSTGTYDIWISSNNFDSSKKQLTINPAGNAVGVPNVNANSGAGGASVSVNAFRGQINKQENTQQFNPINTQKETESKKETEKTPKSTETQNDKNSKGFTGNVVNALGTKGTLASGLLIALVVAGFITSMLLNYIRTGKFRKAKKIFKGVSDYSY